MIGASRKTVTCQSHVRESQGMIRVPMGALAEDPSYKSFNLTVDITSLKTKERSRAHIRLNKHKSGMDQ